MNPKALLIVISLLFCLQFTKAQIGDEIKTFVDSTELMVGNGRKLLLQKVKNDDYVKTKEIYQYLKSITRESNYKAFSYTEELYINLLIGDWNNLLFLFKNYESEGNRNIYPGSVPVASVLYNKVETSYLSLSAALQVSRLVGEDKCVADLYLYLLKSGKVDEEYGKKLKKFRTLYRNSSYDKFVRNYLPGQTSDMSLAFSMGSGVVFPTGKIKTDFSANAGFNFAMDFNVNKIYTSLFVTGASFRLKTPFGATLNGKPVSFDLKDRFQYTNGGLKCGYFVQRNKRFHVAPYLSIGGVSLESTLYENENEDEYKVINSFAYGVGVKTEMRLFKWEKTQWYGSPMPTYLSLKLEGGYTRIAKHRFNYDGNVSEVMLTLVWGMGAF